MPSIDLSSSEWFTFLQLVTTPMVFIFVEANLSVKSAKICTLQKFSAIQYMYLSAMAAVVSSEGHGEFGGTDLAAGHVVVWNHDRGFVSETGTTGKTTGLWQNGMEPYKLYPTVQLQRCSVIV